MLLLQILGGILLVLFLLTLLPISVRAVYDKDKLLVKLHYGFLSMMLYPQKEKKPDKRPKRPAKTTKAAKPEPEPIPQVRDQNAQDLLEPPKAKTAGKRKQLQQRLRQLQELRQAGGKALRALKRHLILDRIYLKLSVGGPDAHQTALRYGECQIAMTNLLCFLGEFVSVKIRKWEVLPDFLLEASKAKISLRARIRPIWLIKAAIHLFWAYIKNQSSHKKKTSNRKGGGNYERKATAH